MPITAKIDEYGKPAWIALTVLGFIIWWPIGLATLAFAIGSGRMMCGHQGGYGRWQHKMDRLQEKMDRVRARMSGDTPWGMPPSGNRAFDEYRAETLRRL